MFHHYLDCKHHSSDCHNLTFINYILFSLCYYSYSFHPELWSHAFYESAKKADYDINRISVIRRVSTGVDVIGLMRHEPFRVKQDPDKRIIYNWQCTCEHGLRMGFCGHVFFCEHCEDLGQTRKPLSVYVRNLNGNRARVGRSPTRMSAALSIE